MLPGIGVFGTNEIVKVLVPFLRTKGFKVEAVWGRTLVEAEEIAISLDIPFFTHHVDEVLLHRDVDLVYIACPPHLHAQIAVKALGIGKHVLCDRPGLCQVETLKMVRAAQYYPTLISVLSYGLRFLPAFVQMRRSIHEGYIGEITLCDVRVQCGSVISERYDWTCEAVMGGGVLTTIGSHIIDVVSFVTGFRAKKVHGVVHTFRKVTDKIKGIRHVTSDDFCTFQMEMSKGIFVTVTLNNHMPGQFVQEVLVCGTKGHVVVRGGDLYGRRNDAKKEEVLFLDVEDLRHPGSNNAGSDAMLSRLHIIPPPLQTAVTYNPDSFVNSPLPKPYMKGLMKLVLAMREAFLSSGENRGWMKEPVASAATFEDGQYIQAVIDAIRKSSQQREWIKVQLITEEPDPAPFLSAAVRKSTISVI